MFTFTLRSVCRNFKHLKTFTIEASFYSTLPEKAIKQGKVVNVAIIGAPNSGKSTLINNILERKICAASNKVHTTTKMARAMCFQDDTQIIFLDTPGMVTEKEQKRYKLPDSMLSSCYKSLRCADVVGVVHDVSNRYTRDSLHPDIVEALTLYSSVPTFLILNKVDKIKHKKQLLACIRNLCNGVLAGNVIPGTDNRKKLDKGYSQFSDVFIVSALRGDGVQDIKEYLLRNAKPSNFQFAPDDFTDQKPEEIITNAVRAKFLDFLPQEIPYNLTINMEYFDSEESKLVSSLTVVCPNERLVKLIAGAGGGRLQQIRTNVRDELIETFKKPVVVDLNLISRETVKNDD